MEEEIVVSLSFSVPCSSVVLDTEHVASGTTLVD